MRVLCLIPRAKLPVLQQTGMDSVVQALGGSETVRLEIIDSFTEANNWVRNEGQGFDRIAVGSGDGGLRAIADALSAAGVPLVILPLGTANDLTRTLGIPLDPLAAAQLAIRGRAALIDLGEVNGHRFFNVAGIGLSVAAARRLAGSGKRWGILSYPMAVADTWKATRTFRIWLDCDGKKLSQRTIQVSIGNGRQHGGGITVAEDAAIDDGFLDVYILHPQSWIRLLMMLPSLRRGTHPYWKNVTALRGREVTITTRHPHAINVDGEIVTSTPARFTVHPGAVQVMAPE